MNDINTDVNNADVNFNFSFAPGVNYEQKLGFEIAGNIWSQHLADSYEGKDLEINIYVEVADDDDSLPDDVVASSFPAIETTKYKKVYKKIKNDVTTELDEDVVDHLLDTNKLDVLVGGKVGGKVVKSSKMHVTTANMKALGFPVEDRQQLDGYILVNNNFNDAEWSYEYPGKPPNEDEDPGTPPEGTLDFLSMAQHEIGHVLGFISGARYRVSDGAMYRVISGARDTEETEEKVGKKDRTMTTMDLFRYSKESDERGINDLSYGREAFFRIDGQEIDLDLTNGKDYQIGHILTSTDNERPLMGPTISLGERWSITENDRIVLDAIGWDVVDPGEIDMEAIYNNALVEVGSAHIADRTHHVENQIFSRDAYNWGRPSSGTGWWLEVCWWREGYFMKKESSTEEKTDDPIHDSDAATEEKIDDPIHDSDAATEEEIDDNINDSDADKPLDRDIVESTTDWPQDVQGDLHSTNETL